LQVKKPSQIEPFDYFYSRDPAFDLESEAFDHERYRETGDLAFLPLVPGRTPTRFRLRPLSSRDRYYCQQKAIEGVGMLAWYAVAIAVEEIDPFFVDDKPHAIARAREGSIVRLSDYDLELLTSVDDGALVAELAERIFAEVSNPKK
jgi:hypothetical protein